MRRHNGSEWRERRIEERGEEREERGGGPAEGGGAKGMSTKVQARIKKARTRVVSGADL